MLVAGDASSEALAGLYSALCLCQELDDDKAVAMLEMVDDQIHANPLQALAPSHRALDTTPAVLALERPAWLKVLQQRGLKPGARWVPAPLSDVRMAAITGLPLVTKL